MRTYFDHEKLDVYQLELRFISWVTGLLAKVKQHSTNARISEVSDQLDRASLSSLLNTAEGNGRRQRQTRAKFFDDARGSATECAGCLDALVAKGACTEQEINEGKEMLLRITSMLTKLIALFDSSSSSSSSSIVREESQERECDDKEDENENENIHLSSVISKDHREIKQASSNWESLDLMHTLMQYRHEPIHSELMKVRDKYSMLHLDALILVYHFAKLCSGAILEIGAFVGGATIAAAFGVRDSGQEKKLIAVEPGGSVKHKRLGTRNVLRDLQRNLARERVANMVTLVKGKSFKPETMSAVHQALGSDQVGLLILDADAAKRRDIDCYRDRFAEGSWMVIDECQRKDHAKPRGRGCISGGRVVGSAGILRLEHVGGTMARRCVKRLKGRVLFSLSF
jgi:four helix bundle protein